MREGHAKPVNRTAALVVSRGESFEWKPVDSTVVSPVPLPIKPFSNNACIASYVDMTGCVHGRLKVLGLSRDVKKRWVCRCVCGIYVLRTYKAITNNPDAASCDHCHKLSRLKQLDYFNRTGKMVNFSEFLK